MTSEKRSPHFIRANLTIIAYVLRSLKSFFFFLALNNIVTVLCKGNNTNTSATKMLALESLNTDSMKHLLLTGGVAVKVRRSSILISLLSSLLGCLAASQKPGLLWDVLLCARLQLWQEFPLKSAAVSPNVAAPCL